MIAWGEDWDCSPSVQDSNEIDLMEHIADFESVFGKLPDPVDVSDEEFEQGMPLYSAPQGPDDLEQRVADSCTHSPKRARRDPLCPSARYPIDDYKTSAGSAEPVDGLPPYWSKPVVEFINDFDPSYVRSHKYRDLRRLRCFPECSKLGSGNECATAGKKWSGSCSVPVRVTINRAAIALMGQGSAIRVFVRITSCDTTEICNKGTGVSSVVKPRPVDWFPADGKNISTSRINENVANESNPSGVFVEGVPEPTDEDKDVPPPVGVKGHQETRTVYSFYSEAAQWNYSWESSRHSSTQKHCLEVLVMEMYGDPKYMDLIYSTTSTPFMVKVPGKRGYKRGINLIHSPCAGDPFSRISGKNPSPGVVEFTGPRLI